MDLGTTQCLKSASVFKAILAQNPELKAVSDLLSARNLDPCRTGDHGPVQYSRKVYLEARLRGRDEQHCNSNPKKAGKGVLDTSRMVPSEATGAEADEDTPTATGVEARN